MAKIMIVDDDPNISLLLEITLKTNNEYEVIKCPDGEKALELVAKEKPNLILLDIMMPGMDGYEVCQRIKSSPETKFVSIIILSSMRGMQDKIKGMNLGADDYIVKPFNPDELLIRIRAQLRIRELEKELIDKRKLETVIAMAVTLQHEINNPLSGIMGNADILKEWRNMNEKDVEECVSVIVEQSTRIRDIVRKMSKVTEVVESTYIGDTRMINVKKSSSNGIE